MFNPLCAAGLYPTQGVFGGSLSFPSAPVPVVSDTLRLVLKIEKLCNYRVLEANLKIESPASQSLADYQSSRSFRDTMDDCRWQRLNQSDLGDNVFSKHIQAIKDFCASEKNTDASQEAKALLADLDASPVTMHKEIFVHSAGLLISATSDPSASTSVVYDFGSIPEWWNDVSDDSGVE